MAAYLIDKNLNIIHEVDNVLFFLLSFFPSPFAHFFFKNFFQRGNTGLHFACEKGHLKIVDMLVISTADIALKNKVVGNY